MADSAILTVGLLEGAMLEDAANIIRKGGAVVMTAPLDDGRQRSDARDDDVHAVPEAAAGRACTGRPIRARTSPDCCRCTEEGKLLLDETVTHEYKLAEVNEGYQDMRDGRNIRGVILHDH